MMLPIIFKCTLAKKITWQVFAYLSIIGAEVLINFTYKGGENE